MHTRVGDCDHPSWKACGLTLASTCGAPLTASDASGSLLESQRMGSVYLNDFNYFFFSLSVPKAFTARTGRRLSGLSVKCNHPEHGRVL
jgi:hypothetical protein